jgi:hypothetical protein
MEHPNDAHLRRGVEDTADALAFAMQQSTLDAGRAHDEAAFERAVTTAAALLHGRADGVKEVSLTMGAVTIFIRGPRDDTEIEMDLLRRLHNERGESLIEAAALLWAAGCYLRDQERRVAHAVAEVNQKQSLGNVGVGQARGLQHTSALKAAFPIF